MADNKNTSEKAQVDGIEHLPGQEQEISSSNSQNEVASAPVGTDEAEKVPLATIMAIFVSC
jgi:hypothetical protein